MKIPTTWAVCTVLAWVILSVARPVGPIVHVRWPPELRESRRRELERQFHLTNGALREETTWQYRLTDWSHANIKALVENENVSDTHLLDRTRYQPQSVPRAWQRPLEAITFGGVLSILVIGLAAAYPRTVAWRSEFSGTERTGDDVTVTPHNGRSMAVVLFTAAIASAAMTWFADASFWQAFAAMALVYSGGYVVGSLLIPLQGGLALATVRTVAGLMLTGIAYLLSLVLSVPWFVVPAGVVGMTLVTRGKASLAWQPRSIRFRWSGLTAGVLATVILSPIVITWLYMAPGTFPPVLYNIDTAYSLEKVHALTVAESFPPASLSNLGVRRTYHYGTQAMAAVISRGSGLPPHHALFLVVLPLLTAGLVAAAVLAARYVAPNVPRWVTVPLLLISSPSLSAPFLENLRRAAMAEGFSLGRLFDANLWGLFSNEAQNVGGDFVIVATIAGMAMARTHGWLLPTFLIGCCVIFKTTLGIALISGYLLAEAWRAVVVPRLPSPQMVAAGTLFLATYGLFFFATFQSSFRVEPYAFEHLRTVIPAGWLPGIILDLLWLFLPVIVVLSVRTHDPERRSARFLLMAIAPLVVMNTTRLVHVGEGGEGAGLDWVQISHPVPFLVHAFAVSLASRRWNALGRPRHLVFVSLLALVVVSTAIPAARYSWGLLADPSAGHEFVDNESLGQALAVIPTRDSLIVTNDLRYPAEEFRREDRQLQIPALFGHQAFAVNYAYEPVEHRRPLQRLLQQPQWSDEIVETARLYGWTHLVIRKDYVHPAPVMLHKIFENGSYAVFQFTRGGVGG